MARNGNRFASFIQGFGVGRQMYQDYQAAKDRQEIEKIADAKPEESMGYTAEDGQQLEAIAGAKDADGKPQYTLTANEDGSYKVVPNFQVQAADGTMQAAPEATIQQRKMTDFLGKRVDGAMTEDQVNSARQRAMAGVMARSNPMGAAQMINSLTAAERDTQRFGWERANNVRAQAKAVQADEDEVLMRGIDTQAGDWLKGRLKNADGTDRAAGFDDHLAATQFRAAKLAEAGKLGEAAQVFKDYAAQSHVKLQLETAQREEALGKAAAALASGDLDGVKDFYNRFIPDGAKVTNVKRGGNGQITIERETMDGRKMAPTVLKDTGQLVSALAAFKDPMAVYQYAQNEFRNNLATRADARAGAAEGRARAAEGRAAEEFAAGAPQRELTRAVGSMQLGLASTDDPAQQAAIRSRLNAVMGGAAPGGKGQPPSGYRWTADGSLEAIPGGPGDKPKGKPMPDSAAKGLLENQVNLRRAQTALALLSGEKAGGTQGDGGATGMKGYLPNQLLNRIDPSGVDTRAAIADLASLVIHDRSGAAVTAAEFPRLAPFIPTEKDDPATARKKLRQFVQNYQAQLEDTAEFYKSMGYNVPLEQIQAAPRNAAPAAAAPAGPAVAQRFSTDPAMRQYKLGKPTAQGIEVLDASGKLVGHYQ